MEARLPVAGRHMALNAAAALLVADACGLSLERSAAALGEVKIPHMRMQVLERDGVTILLDAYNAAPASFLSALETLAELPCKGDRLVVMGEMRELGSLSESAHAEVGRAIARSNVRRACFFGPGAVLAREACLSEGLPAENFRIAEDIEAVQAFVASARAGDTLLIKGSRALELERALDPVEVAH